MKKPITIGVIAVIATILLTSAVDYSVIGAKPIDPIHLELANAGMEGMVSCPNNDTIETQLNILSFTEPINEGKRGDFLMQDTSGSAKWFKTFIWGGEVQSNQFALKGIGFANPGLAEFCGETFVERTIVTIWGECGQDVTVSFESELGYSGSFTGNVLCV